MRVLTWRWCAAFRVRPRQSRSEFGARPKSCQVPYTYLLPPSLRLPPTLHLPYTNHPLLALHTALTPLHSAGQTAVLAEELTQLEHKVSEAQRIVSGMEAACEEFRSIRAQITKAGAGLESVAAREVLTASGERVLGRMEEGAKQYKRRHAPLQQIAMSLIQKLPADYRSGPSIHVFMY